MDKNVSALLNAQITKEFYSAYLYLDLANFYESKGLNGFASWYEIQAKEELDHGMLMYRYLHNNGEQVTLGAIEKPNKTFESLSDPLRVGLEHERFVTSSIHEVYAAAKEASDFRAMQFLDWFVKEQGEEEKNAQDLLTKMELFGEDPRSLYLLNQELAARVYSAPSLVL